jgi:phospholipase C
MSTIRRTALAVSAALASFALAAHARGSIHRVKHVIVLMQENHSFDNYFGALPYVPGGPYRAGPCDKHDHACVDGLTCSRGRGGLTCSNSNLDDDGSTVVSFHLRNFCVAPDLNHEWPGSHQEANFNNPALTRLASPNDGFVRVNDATEQLDNGVETPTEDETMGFYDQGDLPFYYALAQTFAISDRYFSSVIGPTFPNRSYELAATSFGHLTTAEIFPPPGGYKPITGTIMDLLDRRKVSWINFFSDLPTTAIFRPPDIPNTMQPVPQFFAKTPPRPAACGLPAVSFVDPGFGLAGVETDEHPPADIRLGQAFVSRIIAAFRASSCWDDSILFLTYDEHGGFYDHVAPPRAKQGGARNPDGIDPGLCADASNPPASERPGGGQQCDVSRFQAAAICPGFAPPPAPSGPYPAFCANFDQLGFRVPFIAVSPFSRPRYVSHEVADHTSMLAFIEKRFLSGDDGEDEDEDERPHLTARDRHASTLEDLFDFERAPSARAPVPAPTAPDASCRPAP